MDTVGNAVCIADAAALTEGDWKALRRESIGSSDAAAVLGMGKYGSPFKVYQAKVDGTELEQSFAMTLGHLMEPLILDLAAKELNMVVDKPDLGLTHPEHPCMTCNLDGYGTNRYGEEAVIEAKHAGAYLKGMLTEWNDTLVPPPGSPVEAWWVQLQHQLAITQISQGYLAALCDKQFFCIPVHCDEKFIARLETEIPAWFERHITKGEEPAYSGADADVVRDLYPQADHDAEPMDMGPVAEAVINSRAIRASIKELKGRLKDLDVEIKAHLGEAAIGTLDGEKVVSSFNVTRKSVCFGSLKDYYPEAYDRHVTEKTTRTYRF